MPLKVMPMLTLVLRSVPAIWNGWRSASSSRSASADGVALAVEVDGQHRELVAAQPRDDVARAQLVLMRCATATRNSSPTAWPRLSLMSLKRSKSRNIRPKGLPVPARACSSAWSSCCWKRCRLGSPVRLSWKARWCRPASALRRAVTSCTCRIRHGRVGVGLGEQAAVHGRPEFGIAWRWRSRQLGGEGDVSPASCSTCHLRAQRAAVAVVDEVTDRLRLRSPRSSAQAEQLAQRRVGLQDAAVEAHQRHADRGMREGAVEALFARLQLDHMAGGELGLALGGVESAHACGFVGLLPARKYECRVSSISTMIGAAAISTPMPDCWVLRYSRQATDALAA